jgi:aspartate carbamoyltransferase catalytic subunit
MAIRGKDLLGIKELSIEEIELILDTSSGFKDVLQRDIKKVPTMRGRTVVNLFFEPSTRTRTSFELAAKRLSYDVVNFSSSTSSLVKGETLKDTALTVEALGAEIVIARHGSSGVSHMLSKLLGASVINAGDGSNEHPTQALLDAFTMRQMKGSIKGLEVAIVGDVVHSRVARSNIYCLLKMGAKIRLVGPPTLVPDCFSDFGVDVYHDMDEGIKGADVVMALRIQMERQTGGFLPSTSEYFRYWGLTHERMRHTASDAIVMHPGPMNRGIEITSSLADGPRSVILEQVTNGLAVRMAIMYLLAGGTK